MMTKWREDTPIYIQLKDQVITLILNKTYEEGTALPSVRSVSAEFNINHLTVAKSYQILVDLGLVEKRRGLGMFVQQGAQQKLMAQQQDQFYNSELPKFLNRVKQLGITGDAICEYIKKGNANITNNPETNNNIKNDKESNNE